MEIDQHNDPREPRRLWTSANVLDNVAHSACVVTDALSRTLWEIYYFKRIQLT